MQSNKIHRLGAMVLAALWLVLTVFAWCLPPRALSESERRPLAQPPQVTVQDILDGSFMKEFETYALDQFPGRDSFRKLKALFHYYALNRADNNEIYLAEDHAAKLLYPLDVSAVELAMSRLQHVYDKYLKDANAQIYMAVIPDKSFYLAPALGYPTMDYDAMFSLVQEKAPWAEHISLTDVLDIEDYYKTDIHWRQENLLPVAQKLTQTMNLTVPEEQDFTKVSVDRPFYGVYYGQAALPMQAETMYLMESSVTGACTVYDHETGKTMQVYDPSMLESKDLYDIFLGGAKSLLTVENPNAKTDRELIVFRDSFAGALVPLLLQDYAAVTLVDIRYISPEVLGNFVEFAGQDVLILYSTTVLNTKGILK
ncbi:MAG: hypothetical protein J6J43_04355 [Oscillospiraceae bacterium]|nr:hypothetical protein [Oscillospiraceae bacterium]